MSEDANALLWIGFAIASAGFAALNFMNFAVRRHQRGRDLRHITKAEYLRLVKERWAWPWPFYTAAICIPVGIIVALGAIVYNNHMKFR
jgi:hypothetical protein